MGKRIIFAVVAIALVVSALLPISLTQAQSGNTWTLSYYPNTSWAGSPVFIQSASLLNFNWGTNPPGPNMPATNWTMRATTDAFFYGGTNRFQVNADDGVALYIDNVLYLSTIGQTMAGKTFTVDVPLAQGTHNVRVDFLQSGGPAYLYLTWFINKPSGPTPTPGPSYPHPPPPQSQSSVTTPFGNYTSCIQQNIHQSNCFQQNGEWNSPNLGSIQMEPQITIWANCSPADSDYRFTMNPNVRPPITQTFRCSKTLAGYFPTS